MFQEFIQVGPDPNLSGLTTVRVATPQCSATLALFGGCLLEFEPVGQSPLLFTSSKAVFDSEKAIRGGIPICYPWFNAHPKDDSLPSHGYARIREWTLEFAEYDARNECANIALSIQIDGMTLKYLLKLGATIQTSLGVENMRADQLSYELVQHSYFSVGDIGKVQIQGLGGATSIDQLDGDRASIQGDLPITIEGEYDRIFQNAATSLKIEDRSLERVIHIETSEARSAVVWNPWIEKSARMSDLGDDDWEKFVCVETGNIGQNEIILPPGTFHHQDMTISVE